MQPPENNYEAEGLHEQRRCQAKCSASNHQHTRLAVMQLLHDYATKLEATPERDLAV